MKFVCFSLFFSKTKTKHKQVSTHLNKTFECFVLFCFVLICKGKIIEANTTYVMWSSKMSLKSKMFIFWHFLLKFYFGKNPVEIGQFDSWEIAFWVITKAIKTKKLPALFGYIFKLIFASFNSFWLFASHIFSWPFYQPLTNIYRNDNW